MPTWVIVVIMATMRAVYSAAIEGLVTWILVNLILPNTYKLSYWLCFALWFVIGFIISSIRITKLFKE